MRSSAENSTKQNLSTTELGTTEIFLHNFCLLVENVTGHATQLQTWLFNLKTKNYSMKKAVLFLIAALMLISFSACNKCKEDCELIPAKLIRYDCDQVIFQLLINEMPGDNTWTDVNSGQVYSNVVSCFNTCEIAAITNGEYVTLYVKPEKTELHFPVTDCFQCQAIANHPPNTKVIFKEMSTKPCAAVPE